MMFARLFYVFVVTGCIGEATHSLWLAAAAGITLAALMQPIQVKK